MLIAAHYNTHTQLPLNFILRVNCVVYKLYQQSYLTKEVQQSMGDTFRDSWRMPETAEYRTLHILLFSNTCIPVIKFNL